MTALLKLFIDLCRLRTAPQEVPHSQLLLLLTAASYFLVALGVSLLDQSLGLALISAAVDTALLAALAYISLWITGHHERLRQTLIALLGTGTLFGLLGWPVIAMLQQVPEGQTSNLGLVLLGLIIWNIVVIGHILRHALDMAMWIASGIALFYIYTSIRVMSALYIAGS